MVDSRLAWYFFKGAVKVHLVTDPLVAARRVLGRPGDPVENYRSVDEAARQLARRSDSVRQRFLSRYGVDKTLLQTGNLLAGQRLKEEACQRSTAGINPTEATAMTDATPGQSGPERPRTSRQFRRSRGRRIGDAIIGVFVRAGLVPNTYMLTTTGRKTGRSLTHPATVVEDEHRRWLVSPYGRVSWVYNARAAGQVCLARGGKRVDYAVRELSAAEAGPVLKRYVAVAAATRPYFDADKDSPAEVFVAEADRHPVFELLPISGTRRPTDHAD